MKILLIILITSVFLFVAYCVWAIHEEWLEHKQIKTLQDHTDKLAHAYENLQYQVDILTERK